MWRPVYSVRHSVVYSASTANYEVCPHGSRFILELTFRTIRRAVCIVLLRVSIRAFFRLFPSFYFPKQGYPGKHRPICHHPPLLNWADSRLRTGTQGPRRLTRSPRRNYAASCIRRIAASLQPSHHASPRLLGRLMRWPKKFVTAVACSTLVLALAEGMSYFWPEA